MAKIELADRHRIERAIIGALQSTIHAHGPITTDLLTFASKRVYGALANLCTMSIMGCPVKLDRTLDEEEWHLEYQELNK